MKNPQIFTFGGVTFKLKSVEMVGPVQEAEDGISYGFLVRTVGHEVEFTEPKLEDAEKRRAAFIDQWAFNLQSHE